MDINDIADDPAFHDGQAYHERDDLVAYGLREKDLDATKLDWFNPFKSPSEFLLVDWLYSGTGAKTLADLTP